ncbi:transcriptional regulator [Candidatus Poribacteria bacterium]|nr:transcriptional regulator [Candidatus Poribacteria bacterium]
MRRVPDVREIRDSMGLSQAKFADRFELPLATLQDWEQGRRRLNRSTQTLMHIIEHEPGAVDRALRKAKGGRR